MEKLSMCRICLAEDGLRSIVGTHLHEMYESLILCPLETKDRRPIYACYICCARLQNCYDLRQICLQSEELLTQMLNRDENQPRLVPVKEKANKKRLSVAHPILLLSLGDLPQVDAASDVSLDIKPPKPLVDVKYENVDEGTADRTVEEDKVDDNMQTSDSDDDVIITNIEHLEGSADINMPMKSSLDAERISEDSIASELEDTPIVTVKVEVEDMKEIVRMGSISSSLTSDREVGVISLGTQQTFLDTSAHILSDIEPSIMEAFWGWGSLTTVAEPQHVQTTVETLPRILPRLAPKPSDTAVSEIDERISRGDYERHRRNDLKILLNNLQQLIPAIRDKKRPTQPRILREATALCRMFTQQEIEKQKLRIKQKQLATRLEELLKPP